MKKLLILITIFAMSTTANALIFSDNFDQGVDAAWNQVDYLGFLQGVGGTSLNGWDGFQSLPDGTGAIATMNAMNFVDTNPAGYNGGYGWIPGWPPPPVPETAWDPDHLDGAANGVLRMASRNGAWADASNNGPFLYKNVTGSFSAEVQVVSNDYWWHECGGLMARAANPNGAGANENWVYLSFFPQWGVGNHIRNTVNGVSTEMAWPWKSYTGDGYCDPYLQIIRIGTTFYFNTSSDGVNWASLPGLEAGVDRPDLPAELQVGIWSASYSSTVANFDFDNFKIGEVIPEPATITLLGLGGLFLVRRRK